MARVPDEEIERLKEEVDLAELVIRSGVALKKQGKDLMGCCPFHQDDTPSLVVTTSKNLWHCMGACQTGGSAIDWVMKTQGVSFRHAVEVLRAGVTPAIVSGRRRPVATRSQSQKLPSPLDSTGEDQAVLAQVVDYYHQGLAESPEALAYLARRKIDDPAAVSKFRLGFASRTLGYRLPNKQTKEGAAVRGRLQALGVLRTSGHEHFTGSLVVPVIAPDGTVTEVYGRKLRADPRTGQPAHLYLPGPHKGVWNEEALSCGEVVLCESLIDALTFYVAGFTNVTASYGTSGFTADHDEAFARYGVTRVLLAYDHDAAGDHAAAKLAAKLMDRGIECFRVVFADGTDANEAAVGTSDPIDVLGSAIRNAQWMGKGASVSAARHGDEDRDGEDRDDGDDPVLPSAASLPPASPVPETPTAPEVEVTGSELRLVSGPRTWRVRGLAPAASFDTLRVNVAVADVSGPLFVDTLDLYSAKARGLFVRDAAVALATEEAVVRRELGRVLLACEEATDAADISKGGKDRVPTMSPAERDRAMALLRDPDLAGRIAADVGRLGVVGEETNALLCYLAVVSRKCEKPLGVLVQSSSAAGKSTLAEAVLSLVPPEEVVAYSAMTGQSLYYLGENDLAHKVLSIAEEEGASRASYALKLLQSEGKLSIASTGKDATSGKLTTFTYEVTGPVALLTTTTAVCVDEELANRLVIVAVSEEVDQTRAIHVAQRHALTVEGLVARAERAEITAAHRNAQRLLESLPVVVPDAASLTFASVTTRARRDHAKYLGLICASALLHQHQRERRSIETAGGEITYIEATADDVALADRLAADVLVRDTDELTPATRRVFDALVAWEHAGPFTRKEARDALGFGDTQLKIHLARLCELEMVVLTKTPTGYAYDVCATPGEPDRSGSEPTRSGAGRVPVAGRSGPGRGVENHAEDQEEADIWPQPVGFPPRRVAGEPPLAVVAHIGG